jgi:CheY-like chemotaxis protein
MQALSTAKEFQPDVVILDFLMPRAHGGDVAWQLASETAFKHTPRMIFCSGVPTSEFALKLPPVKIAIMEKPVDSEALLKLLRSAPE